MPLFWAPLPRLFTESDAEMLAANPFDNTVAWSMDAEQFVRVTSCASKSWALNEDSSRSQNNE